jgi:hypothetical protein
MNVDFPDPHVPEIITRCFILSFLHITKYRFLKLDFLISTDENNFMCEFRIVSNAALEKKNVRRKDFGEYGAMNAEDVLLKIAGINLSRTLEKLANFKSLDHNFIRDFISCIPN